MSETKGKYRIQTVAEMTGVPASTLRTWEQRYGFPTPDRTASAYRVYSDDDIREIVRVRELCERGLAPAEAVQEVLGAEAAAPPAKASAAAAPVAAAVPGLFELGRQVVQAVASFDPDALERHLRTALVVGSHHEVMAQTIEPAWREIRRRWFQGELGRHHERLAAERLSHLARDLARAAQPPSQPLNQPRTAARWALVGCFEDDDDVVSALAAALALQSARLRVAFLGPRTPALAVRDAAKELDAVVVALAVGDAPAPRRARDLLDEYAAAIGSRAWVVTGLAADGLREAVERGGGRVLDTSAQIEAFAASITRES